MEINNQSEAGKARRLFALSAKNTQFHIIGLVRHEIRKGSKNARQYNSSDNTKYAEKIKSAMGGTGHALRAQLANYSFTGSDDVEPSSQQ